MILSECSAKEKADKTFAFSYLKIMKEDGSIVQDGSHELYVYKVWVNFCLPLPFFSSLPFPFISLPLPSSLSPLPPFLPPSSQLLSLPPTQAEGRKWYDPRTYLQNPSCKDDVMSQRSSRTFTMGKMDLSTSPVHITRSFRETIHISTLTCSTKLTQTSMCEGVRVWGCMDIVV